MSAARKPPPAEEEPSFETRLEHLEDLVEALEGGQLTLEEGVERFRQGVQLIKGLHDSLKGAEQKIEVLGAELQAGLEELEGGGGSADEDDDG